MSNNGSLFETGVATDVGRVRMQNEDAVLVHDGAGAWAVADGMGGHSGGAFASGSVVEALAAMQPPRSAADLLAQCQTAALKANERIRQVRQPGAIVGATLVVLLTYQTAFACVWSGDSRLYRVRNGVIEQWTEDHTEVQELLSSGAITPAMARAWPRLNVVTRAIGVTDMPELDIRDGDLCTGDVFVLCSDGLSNQVGSDEILAAVTSGRPQEAADSLVQLTLERGATDNVTALVVRCIYAREPTVVLGLRPGNAVQEPQP